jgi:hypothetical protein
VTRVFAIQVRRLQRWVILAPAGTVRFWLCQTVLLSRLATSRRSRLKLIVVGLFLPAHDVLPLLRNSGPFGLDITYGQVQVRWWVRCRSDLHVMNELLLGG